MKSYTDIEQSKKLSKILPIKSADMIYMPRVHTNITHEYCKIPEYFSYDKLNEDDRIFNNLLLPCWSLAALLNVLPKYEIYNNGEIIQLDVNLNALATEGDETLLDLVVNMIIHLHEL